MNFALTGNFLDCTQTINSVFPIAWSSRNLVILLSLCWAAWSIPYACVVQGSIRDLSKTLIYKIQGSSSWFLLLRFPLQFLAATVPLKFVLWFFMPAGLWIFWPNFSHPIWTGLQSAFRNKVKKKWETYPIIVPPSVIKLLPAFACFPVLPGNCYIVSTVRSYLKNTQSNHSYSSISSN